MIKEPELAQFADIGPVSPTDSAPPHPFRASPWYDPAIHPDRTDEDSELPLRRRTAAKVLVVLGGIVLPLASMIINQAMGVVLALGTVGLAALGITVVSVLANLVLLPTRKTPGKQIVVTRAPRSTLVCAVLMVGALFSSLMWGYLALLFLPLFPISVIAIVFMGLGLCGLCPYGVLVISLIQSIRAVRLVGGRLGTYRTTAVASLSLLLPVLIAVGLGLYSRAADARFEQEVKRVHQARPYSAARMTLISGLRAEEERVISVYQRSEDTELRRTLAEIYHRLTDQPLSSVQFRSRKDTLIRPWWFMERGSSPLGFGPFDPARKLMRGGF